MRRHKALWLALLAASCIPAFSQVEQAVMQVDGMG